MELCQYNLILDENRHPMLVKEKSYEIMEKVYDNPQDAAALVTSCIRQYSSLAEEYVYMVSFSTSLKPLGIFEVSHGTASESLLNARELFIRALLCGSAGILVAHNHPGGNPSPSADDLAVCRKIQDACRLIGLQMLDFIIIGGEEILSFKTNNLLNDRSLTTEEKADRLL